MSQSPSSRLGNFKAMTNVVRSLPFDGNGTLEHRRRMVADFCRLLGAQFSAAPAEKIAGLSPRHVQTLQRLLAGDSEKQAAAHLGVSPHTLHVYVKALYRHYDASSRGELLARFVRAPGSSGAPAAPSPE